LLKSLTLLVGLALATQASAEMPPSPPADIASAVADCWAAVRPNSIDQAVLRQRGWRAGKISDAQGAVATPLQPYGKNGSNVLVMLMGMSDAPMCSVLSRVENAAAVSKAAQAVQQVLVGADPQVKTARSGKSIVFLSLPRIATLDATGTKDKPAVRIVAGYSAEKK
jgi:hypothetical protein